MGLWPKNHFGMVLEAHSIMALYLDPLGVSKHEPFVWSGVHDARPSSPVKHLADSHSPAQEHIEHEIILTVQVLKHKLSAQNHSYDS